MTANVARTTPVALAEHMAPATAVRATIEPPPVVPGHVSVPRFEFSTRELPPGDQFAAWRHSFAAMLDFAEPDETSAGFAGTQVVWDLGDLALAQVSTKGLGFAGLAGHIRRNPIDHWLLTLLSEGSSQTTTPSRSFDGGAGSVQVHPLGRAFEGHVTDSEMLLLFVPRDFYRDMAYVLDAAEFSALDRGMGRLLADYLTSLALRLPTLDVTDVPGLVAATRAMILACFAPSPENLGEAHEPITAAMLERARCFVQAHLFDPYLDAKALRHELGISRSRLYRLFETSGGVMHYIQHRRLLAARAALADPTDHRRILDIGEEHGFGDGAEFSRAFKREFGCRPSDVREGINNGRSNWQTDDEQNAAPGERLGLLLRRLQA